MVILTDSFLQPLFGTKLSPSPSSEGELATLTQVCLRGGRTNTIKREGANAKVDQVSLHQNCLVVGTAYRFALKGIRRSEQFSWRTINDTITIGAFNTPLLTLR